MTAADVARAAERSKLLELLDAMAEGTPCRFDHHGYCQEHQLHSPPCPHAEADALLRREGIR